MCCTFDEHFHPINKQNIASKQKVRIIQNNLVFVNGIPLSISNLETLANPLYFGRYGFVQKIIFSSANQSHKNLYTQAYITYSNPIQASLAITALDGYSINSKPLKVSFGTTKYCTYFLGGYKCQNKDCFYLHQLQPENELISWESKEVFKKQTSIAIATVTNNIHTIIPNLLINPYEQITDGFPTITQTINSLYPTISITKPIINAPTTHQPSLFQEIDNYWVDSNPMCTFETDTDGDSNQSQPYPSLQQLIHSKIISKLSAKNWLCRSVMFRCDEVTMEDVYEHGTISSIMRNQLNQ